MVLVKKKKKKRFREEETRKTRFGSFGKRERQLDSEGRAEKRKCFHLPSHSFIPSCSISI